MSASTEPLHPRPAFRIVSHERGEPFVAAEERLAGDASIFRYPPPGGACELRG